MLYHTPDFVVLQDIALFNDPELCDLAVRLVSYIPADRYIFFEFEVDRAASTIYPEDQPVRRFWRRDK